MSDGRERAAVVAKVGLFGREQFAADAELKFRALGGAYLRNNSGFSVILVSFYCHFSVI